MDLPVAMDCKATSGFNLYLQTGKKIASFLKTFEEEHITWLEEILLEARKTFTRRSLTLLPKTPSTKRMNRRIRPIAEEPDDNSGSPPAKRRTQRKSKLFDAIDETDQIQSGAPLHATRSTRASTRSATQEGNKHTTRGKQNQKPKSVSILETSEESSSEIESGASCNTDYRPEKEHRVKKLINRHEKMISESSDDDFQSPKRLRKFINTVLDAVPENAPQAEKQNHECIEEKPVPIAQKPISEEHAVNIIAPNFVSPVKESGPVPSEESVVESIEPMVNDESIIPTTDDEEAGSQTVEDAKFNSDECDKEQTDSKSSSEDVVGKDVVVEETKEEVNDSMEEDSLNESSSAAPTQTSFMLNSVRMSITMSKSKTRSSMSKRRLSRDTNVRKYTRQSLRASKRFSKMSQKNQIESCQEKLQEESDRINAEENLKTRSPMSKHQLSCDTNVRKSLRVSKQLSIMSQKSIMESSEEKSQEESDSSNAEERSLTRSSMSKRRLSCDTNVRKSLRVSKQLSMMSQKNIVESSEEKSQEESVSSNAEERSLTRSSMSKRRLSSDTNVRKSVRRSSRVSKRLSQKNHMESCEEKSQEGSDSNAEERMVIVTESVPVEVVAECSPGHQNVSKNTMESAESNSSSESSVELKPAVEAKAEPKRQTRSRTKQRKPPKQAAQTASNDTLANTSNKRKQSDSDASENSSPEQKNTRTRTKTRKYKKSPQSSNTVDTAKMELQSDERSAIYELVDRRTSGMMKKGVKRSPSTPSCEDGKKKSLPRCGKKIRLSHPVKVEVIDLSTDDAASQNQSEQFDDSLEPTSSEKMKVDGGSEEEPRRKSRRRTHDSDPGTGEAVSLAAGNMYAEQQPKKQSLEVYLISDESSDEGVVEKTPSPKCPAGDKIIRAHPQSFFNKKKDEGIFPTNSNGIITSFIKRNTPKKKTLKERQEEIKAQIREKQRKEAEIRKKLQQDKKNKMEEQKRKREERARKAAEARERRILQQNEKRQKLEEFYEHKQAFTEKQKEERKREDMQKKRIVTKKRLEAEERRRLEDDNRLQKLKQQEEEEKRYKEMMSRKREFEEQERLQKQEEWRQQQELRRAEQEKQRLEESKRRRELELENEREQQRLKEQREKERRELERMRIQEAEMRERERKAREEAEEQKKIEAERIRREQERKKEREHLKQMMMKEKQQNQIEDPTKPQPKLPLSTNTTALNTTVTKDPEMQSPQSYDLTPQRVHKPSTDENYCIDDINSEDSTDDEEHPRKKIPSWAQGAALRAHLIHQIRFPVNLDTIFGEIEPPDLTKVFQKKRTRYLKRTSSAVWNSPIFKKY